MVKMDTEIGVQTLVEAVWFHKALIFFENVWTQAILLPAIGQ